MWVVELPADMSAILQILLHATKKLQHHGLLNPGVPVNGGCKRLCQQIEGVLPLSNLLDVAEIFTSENRGADLFV